MKKNINAIVIVQARMGSTRLPGKVLMDIAGKPVLWHIITRLKRSRTIKKIVVATTVDQKDDVIAQFCEKYKVDCYRGSEEDVLDRYYQAAGAYNADPIIRVGADCPFIDPAILDRVISKLLKTKELDYVCTGDNYPEGVGVEAFWFNVLEKTWRDARLSSEREHVTSYIWKNETGSFNLATVELEKPLPRMRVILDEESDYDVILSVRECMDSDFFSFEDIVRLCKEKPYIFEKNKHIMRDAGYIRSLGEDSDVSGKV